MKIGGQTELLIPGVTIRHFHSRIEQKTFLLQLRAEPDPNEGTQSYPQVCQGAQDRAKGQDTTAMVSSAASWTPSTCPRWIWTAPSSAGHTRKKQPPDRGTAHLVLLVHPRKQQDLRSSSKTQPQERTLSSHQPKPKKWPPRPFIEPRKANNLQLCWP